MQSFSQLNKRFQSRFFLERLLSDCRWVGLLRGIDSKSRADFMLNCRTNIREGDSFLFQPDIVAIGVVTKSSIEFSSIRRHDA